MIDPLVKKKKKRELETATYEMKYNKGPPKRP